MENLCDHEDRARRVCTHVLDYWKSYESKDESNGKKDVRYDTYLEFFSNNTVSLVCLECGEKRHKKEILEVNVEIEWENICEDCFSFIVSIKEKSFTFGRREIESECNSKIDILPVGRLSSTISKLVGVKRIPNSRSFVVVTENLMLHQISFQEYNSFSQRKIDEFKKSCDLKNYITKGKELMIKASPCGNFVAVGEKYSTRGIVVDLSSKNDMVACTMFSRIEYHPEHCPFPMTFFQHEGSTLFINSVEWNKCQIVRPEDGSVVLVPHDQHYEYFFTELHTSPNSVYIINSGWVWQPAGVVDAYKISKLMEEKNNPSKVSLSLSCDNEWNRGICFIDDETVIIDGYMASMNSNEGFSGFEYHQPGIEIWNIPKKEMVTKVVPCCPYVGSKNGSFKSTLGVSCFGKEDECGSYFWRLLEKPSADEERRIRVWNLKNEREQRSRGLERFLDQNDKVVMGFDNGEYILTFVKEEGGKESNNSVSMISLYRISVISLGEKVFRGMKNFVDITVETQIK